ncbi:C-type lectin domain family 14 member A [Notothenia coriiceps]|uniref:C-type lectin domain family 14 member A n=1 Tax=Notothenia coriiceps TaxID=8208 RepID=A0A6I9NA45_9TELE|nr:PREDICTED: complement component C1q receptor-like [Notothenia coriiceps]
MKMMWFWFCWVLGPVVLASPPLFSLHPSPAIFSAAEDACPPGGLASLFSDQEVSAVLNLVSGSNGSVFWVGLRKVKDACVDPGLPLRGFSWTGGGSQAPQGVRWAQEPQETCTTLRCAAIRLNQTGTSGTSWGLIPVSCRSKNPYICKGRGTWVAPAPGPKKGKGPEKRPEKRPEPTQGPGPEPALAPEAKPTPQKESAAPEPSEKEQPQPSKPDTPQATPVTQDPEPDLKTKFGPEPDLKPDSGTEPHLKPDSGTEPDPCPRPQITGTRSLREDNKTRALVVCWSGLQLDLVCSGRPPAWHLTDGSVANQSAACQLCEPGFIRTGSGDCEDIDECSGGAGPCRTSCLNTPGSYRSEVTH